MEVAMSEYEDSEQIEVSARRESEFEEEQSLSIELVDESEKQSFQAIRNQLEQFLELKIEDSFGLNSIDGRDKYSISKSLKDEFHHLRERDVLAWR
jgi:hypothetical protein